MYFANLSAFRKFMDQYARKKKHISSASNQKIILVFLNLLSNLSNVTLFKNDFDMCLKVVPGKI